MEPSKYQSESSFFFVKSLYLIPTSNKLESSFTLFSSISYFYSCLIYLFFSSSSKIVDFYLVIYFLEGFFFNYYFDSYSDCFVY